MAVVEENYKILNKSQTKELAQLIEDFIPDYLKQREESIVASRLSLDKELLQMLLATLVEDYCHILKYIDLSEVSFAGIDISRKNFESTNANIDPQTVYCRDLTYTILKGLNMDGKSFKGTLIKGANLEDTNAFINIETIYTGIDGAILKGCIVTNVSEDIKDNKELEGATIIDSYYDASKQYIKSLFNKD